MISSTQGQGPLTNSYVIVTPVVPWPVRGGRPSLKNSCHIYKVISLKLENFSLILDPL